MTQSLYRKYRPQTFGDVVGQQHIVSTFSNAIADGKISHAYLFTGPRGTGKTTTARLLAKSLLCESGPGVVPDGTCEQCIAVACGTHPDVYELDAASRTGVDNVREEIVNRVDFAPSLGRYKVYIIDEVHMLTTAAFNALLKTLEEPPEHVVFILCTTDPQKVPDTIHSRCQRFDFHRISTEDIVGRLKHVCEQEGFDFEVPALDMIAKHARGGLRDALTALEQLSVFGNGSITLASASEVLGESASSTLSETAYLIAARDVSGLFDKVATLVENGGDPTRFLHDLSSHIRNVYVVACVGMKEGTTEASGNELVELNNEAVAFGGTDRLVRIMSIMAEATDTMRFSTDQRLTLELAFARMARPEGDLSVDSLAERVEALELKLAVLQKKGPVTASPVTAAPAPSVPSVASQSSQSVPVVVPETTPVAVALVSTPPVPVAQPVPRTADTDIPATAEASGDFDRATMDRLWQSVVSRVGGVKASYGALLRASRSRIDKDGKFWVILPPNSKFAVRALSRPDVVSVLGQQITEVFGQAYRVEYTEEQGSPESAPARDSAANAPAVVPAAPHVQVRDDSPVRQAPPVQQSDQISSAPEYDGPPLDAYDDYVPAQEAPEPVRTPPEPSVHSGVDETFQTPAPKPVKVFDKKDEDLKITRPQGKRVDSDNPVASLLIGAFGEDTVVTEIEPK